MEGNQQDATGSLGEADLSNRVTAVVDRIEGGRCRIAHAISTVMDTAAHLSPGPRETRTCLNNLAADLHRLDALYVAAASRLRATPRELWTGEGDASGGREMLAYVRFLTDQLNAETGGMVRIAKMLRAIPRS